MPDQETRSKKLETGRFRVVDLFPISYFLFPGDVDRVFKNCVKFGKSLGFIHSVVFTQLMAVFRLIGFNRIIHPLYSAFYTNVFTIHTQLNLCLSTISTAITTKATILNKLILE